MKEAKLTVINEELGVNRVTGRDNGGEEVFVELELLEVIGERQGRLKGSSNVLIHVL